MNKETINELFSVIIDEENDVVIKQKYADRLWFLVEEGTDLPHLAITQIKGDLKSSLDAEGWVDDEEVKEVKNLIQWKKWLKIRRNKKDGKYAIVKVWKKQDKVFESIDKISDDYKPGIKFEMLTYQDKKAKRVNKQESEESSE